MPHLTIGKDETRVVPILWLGQDSELEYDVTLAEPGAKVVILGLLIGRDTDNLALKVKVRHAAPNTTSEVVIKSALSGSAKVSIEGLVAVDHGAKGTKAWLAAHLLLLSPHAKGVAVPSLEIMENDIKAGHGTTVGRISEEEMFYLMSRGLPSEAARQLIVHGFLASLAERFPAEMRERVKAEMALV